MWWPLFAAVLAGCLIYIAVEWLNEDQHESKRRPDVSDRLVIPGWGKIVFWLLGAIVVVGAGAYLSAYLVLLGKGSDQGERLARLETNQANLEKKIDSVQASLEKRLDKIDDRLDTLAKAAQYQDSANALLAKMLSEAKTPEESFQLQRGAPYLFSNPEYFGNQYGGLPAVQKYRMELQRIIEAKKLLPFRTLEYRPPK